MTQNQTRTSERGAGARSSAGADGDQLLDLAPHGHEVGQRSIALTGFRPAPTAIALAATLGPAAAGWVVSIREMNGMDMGVGTGLGSLAFFIVLWVWMMAAMMLPGTAPALVRRAEATNPVLAVPLFVGSYVGVWTLVGLAVYGLYRPRTCATHVRRRREIMTAHKTGTHDQWLAARLELLEAEKAHTRRSDELARLRQELPWVRVDKEYRFETEEGRVSLGDLFGGRSQLLVYHFMFRSEYKAGCPACSAIADGFDGFVIHLANHDVTLCAVSRAPLAKLQAYKQRMGWTFPWASSFDSEFNYDFQAAHTE